MVVRIGLLLQHRLVLRSVRDRIRSRRGLLLALALSRDRSGGLAAEAGEFVLKLRGLMRKETQTESASYSSARLHEPGVTNRCGHSIQFAHTNRLDIPRLQATQRRIYLSEIIYPPAPPEENREPVTFPIMPIILKLPSALLVTLAEILLYTLFKDFLQRAHILSWARSLHLFYMEPRLFVYAPAKPIQQNIFFSYLIKLAALHSQATVG
jgi:hypothetical protein